MKVITKEFLLENKKEFIQHMTSGMIFIYPTDTIYGIGCNALNESSIDIIRKIKKRPKNPFSVIAPSKDWIKNNCYLDNTYLDKLPGPFTFICNLKHDCVAKSVNPSSKSLGVRIPNNWFTRIIGEAGIPFVTTSVNLAGKPFLKNPKDLNIDSKKVDYLINDGFIDGKPSTIIDFTKDTVEVKER